MAFINITGTLTSGAGDSSVVLDCSDDIGTVTAKITGTWVGTIFFQGSLDGTNWDIVSGTDLSTLDGQVPTSTTANGNFSFNAASLKKVRMFASGGLASGTATVVMGGSPGCSIITANQAFQYIKMSEADSLIVKPFAYATRIDEASATVTYIGKADPGTATSASSWQVSKVSVSGTVTLTQFADGDSSFDNVWDNRASLSYS